jgi:hypothetical protein
MSYITPLPGYINSSGASIPSGYVGEKLSATILYANRVNLTSNVTATITSLLLPQGYYEITGFIGATNIDNVYILGGINSAPTLPSSIDLISIRRLTSGTSSISGVSISGKAFALSTSTTLYLVASCSFTGGPPQIWGSITAVRTA